MLVEDYLRPGAVKAGVLFIASGQEGKVMEDDLRQFFFIICVTAFATFLIRIKTDPKTVQTLLRHNDIRLTTQFYSHAIATTGWPPLGAILSGEKPENRTESGLK